MKNELLQSLAKWGQSTGEQNATICDTTKNQNATIEVCIRVTTTKDGSKIAEYTVKGDPNTATGKAAWYWQVLETVVREAGLVKERSKSLFDVILGGR